MRSLGTKRLVLLLALATMMCAILPVATASAVIHPHILSLNASYGVPGNTITITGYGFGATQLTANVGFSAYNNAGSITSWSDTQIVCTVPTLTVVPYGPHYVTVWDMGGYYSNELPFVIEDPVVWIHSLSPTHGAPGTPVTITGHGFGATKGASILEFFGAVGWAGIVTPSSWSDTQITIVVPPDVAVGQHEVNVSTSKVSNYAVFNVDPAITGLTPTKAKVGKTVTITGTGFGPTRGVSKVYFGKKAVLKYVSWSDTQVKVKVPLVTKGSRPVKVVTRFGTTAPKAFKVIR